jgi:AcrR family transcriptional regulator
MARLSVSARQTLVLERKDQILKAAAKIFAAKGYERATIADIAREAGMAEGSIYNYFKNKGDLLVSLPRHAIQPPFESLLAQGVAGTPEEVLTIIARTIIGAIKDNAHIFRILLSSLPNMSKRMRQQYLDQVIVYAGQMIEGYFRELIRQGVFRPNDRPDVLALAFVGMFFPTVLIQQVIQIEFLGPIDTDQIVDTCVKVFMHGALARPDDAPAPRAHRAIPVE